MVLLQIEEEYGYRYWHCYVSEARYKELHENFDAESIDCLMPVTQIIPEAMPGYVVLDEIPDDIVIRNAHIHEPDDSWMEEL